MAIFNTLPESINEVDVIVAGGGSAGCIVAAGLAEADAGLSILVVERGPNNDLPIITHPALFMANLAPDSKTVIHHTTKPEKQLGGRSILVSTGGLLGGGSSANMTTYSRPQCSDFDAWNMPGWSAEEMMPFVKKLETYNGPGDRATHGDNGPLHVGRGPYHNKRLEDQFIAAAAEVGWPEVEDAQSMDTINRFHRVQRYVTSEGKRQDTATCYLHPLLQSGNYPNLHVLIETEIIRVLFDENKRASGVEFRPTPALQSQDSDGPVPIRKVHARKLVVVSAGALGTPPILERSGVGSREILENAGVDLVADVGGVGMEYHDHQLALAAYHSSLGPRETLDALLGGRMDAMAAIANNDPMLGWNCQDATSKLRPSETEVDQLGAEFREAWDRDFKNIPTKPLAAITCIAGYPSDPSEVPAGQYVSTSAFSTHPYSHGHIHITGPTLDDPLDFQTGIFTNPVDVKMLVWAFKKQREIVRRLDCYRGELAQSHPPYPAASKAASVKLHGPLPRPVHDIEYTAEDDAILEDWLYKKVAGTWHSVGTCKMAPQSKGGAVDASLSVYGVSGLKLADLSITPGNVSANTANMAYAIGEKAAAIFKAELGLK